MKKFIAGILLGILCLLILGILGICFYVVVQDIVGSHISLQDWLSGFGITALIVFISFMFWKGISWSIRQFRK